MKEDNPIQPYNWFSRILHIAAHELNECMHDQGVIIFVLLLPLAYPLLYGAIYHQQNVADVPVAVVDDSHSHRAREFARRLDATQGAEVVQYCTNMAEAEELMRQMKIYAVAHVPNTFDKDLSEGRQTRIGVYVNMASSLYYKSILLAANNVVLDMNKDISVSYMGTSTERQRSIGRQPVKFEYVPLYNPQSGFATFLIPPVLMLILQQTLLLGMGMSMGRARETYRSQLHTLRALYTNPIQIVIGKSIPYFALHLIMATYMFTFVTRCFDLPALGDYLSFLVMVVPFLLACVFMSIVFSALVYRREDCILIFVTLSIPMLFISGIVWPADQMPRFWQWVSYILPSTFGMRAYVKLQSMGATFQQILPEFKYMWCQAIAYFVMACLLYRWRLSLVRQKVSNLKTSK